MRIDTHTCDLKRLLKPVPLSRDNTKLQFENLLFSSLPLAILHSAGESDLDREWQGFSKPPQVTGKGTHG
jgi:hypothetical protein